MKITHQVGVDRLVRRTGHSFVVEFEIVITKKSGGLKFEEVIKLVHEFDGKSRAKEPLQYTMRCRSTKNVSSEQNESIQYLTSLQISRGCCDLERSLRTL